jgi:DNA-directed RNA polymerase sigma subunit (sigma70/sigma32)
VRHGDGADSEFIDFLGGSVSETCLGAAERSLEQESLVMEVKQVLESLPSDVRMYIELRYGLIDPEGKSMTDAQIANAMNLKKSQIHWLGIKTKKVLRSFDGGVRGKLQRIFRDYFTD